MKHTVKVLRSSTTTQRMPLLAASTASTGALAPESMTRGDPEPGGVGRCRVTGCDVTSGHVWMSSSVMSRQVRSEDVTSVIPPLPSPSFAGVRWRSPRATHRLAGSLQREEEEGVSLGVVEDGGQAVRAVGGEARRHHPEVRHRDGRQVRARPRRQQVVVGAQVRVSVRTAKLAQSKERLSLRLRYTRGRRLRWEKRGGGRGQQNVRLGRIWEAPCGVN
jgi:hypothetical protein